MTGGTTSAEGLAGNNAGTGATLGCQGGHDRYPPAGRGLAWGRGWGLARAPPGLKDGLEHDLFRPSVERRNDDGFRPPEGTSERTMFRSAAEEALAVTSPAGRNT
jgi:hypothetical protein